MDSMIRRIGRKFSSYRADPFTRGFIKHNLRYFSGIAKTEPPAGPEVLFELNAFHSAHIAYSYLANVLAKKYGARVIAYEPMGISALWRKLEWKLSRYLSLREFAVYRSFGVSGFLQPQVDSGQLDRARRLTDQILGEIKTKSDIESIRIDGIWLGDLIYDSYLRAFQKPTIEIADESFKTFLLSAIRLYVFWDNYFESHDVRAVNVSHCVYIIAIPLRIAAGRNIPAFQINATHLYQLSNENLIAYTEFIDSRHVFAGLPRNVQEAGLKEAEEKISHRVAGVVGVDMAYSKTSAFGSFKPVRLVKESPRKKILIATHCFFDSPHGYGGNLFPDLYEWLDFLGQITQKTDYDWYIKTHPDYLQGTKEIIDSFVRKYPRLTLLPADSSHRQLIAEGIDVALTVYGTIGFEYAALGVPVINASVCNPHIAYDFNLHPKNIAEYERLLLNLEDMSLQIDKRQVYEYYFMKHIYYSNNWLFKDYNKTIKELGEYKEQFTPKIYEKWLGEWTPERHTQIIGALEKFVDSGELRLAPRHD